MNCMTMRKLSIGTVQNFCRACLKDLKKIQFKISNLNLQIRHWLEDITLDSPMSYDIYSNSICNSCRNKLETLLAFHLMCKQSRKTVDKLFAIEEQNKLKDCTNVELTGEPLLCKGILNVTESKISNNLEELGFSDNVLDKKDDIHSSSVVDFQIKDERTNVKHIIKNKCSASHEIKLSNSKADRKKYTYSFRCDQCKYRSVSQQFLDFHKRIHYGLKPHQCPQCDDSFSKYTTLLKHLNDNHGQKELTIICEHEQCGKEFSNSRSYKDHYRQNHLPQQSSKKEDKSATKSPQRHVCEECGKVYTKLQTFKEHQYTHRPKELYPFQCDICDKSFVKRRTYKEHKLRHAGIKNFECPQCGAKRTTKKELREHMNSHTRERQYPCPNCPMVFYRTSNRRVHIDVVHQGIRRFACRYCDQIFGKGDNLKNHELLHTGEKPHVCSECGKRFVQKVSLRLHMKTHCK